MARFFKYVGLFLLMFIPGALLWGLGTATLSGGDAWIGVVMWGFTALFLTVVARDAVMF